MTRSGFSEQALTPGPNNDKACVKPKLSGRAWKALRDTTENQLHTFGQESLWLLTNECINGKGENKGYGCECGKKKG